MLEKTVLLVINPVAGLQKAKLYMYQIVDTLCQSGYKVMAFSTAKRGDASEVVKKYGAEVDRILCCGGDGTLNEVITGLLQAGIDCPLGYIPSGTTNDLAHALHLPVKVKEAIRVATGGRIRKHDIGVFNNGQYFSYVASFGAFAKVAYGTPQWLKNLIGRMAYFFLSAISVFEIVPHKVTVIADGREISGEFVFCSVSNSSVVGGVMKFLDREVSFDDGQFEVLLVRNPENAAAFSGIIRSLTRHEYDERYVHFFKAKELTFLFEKPTDWTIDGEHAGALTRVDIDNLQCGASFSVPSDSK